MQYDEYGEVPEREAVMASQLRPLLRRWIEQREQAEAFLYGEPKQGVGRNELADASGIGARRLYGIINGEQTYVDLDAADRLLMAMGLHISHVEVVTLREAREASNIFGQQVKAWYVAKGNEWPTQPGAKRLMPNLRRQYAAEHGNAA